MFPRSVAKIISGQPTSDGAGVRLTRMIGTSALEQLDPFLLLDEFKSDRADDYLAGFPDHPHRGFETVTYMLAGTMEHRDPAGNRGELVAGSVQWMTAGRGIVHSEMPQQRDGLMWGFQLWVNLPARDKMTAPRYQDIAPERIPQATLAAGVTARVIAGKIGGVGRQVNVEIERLGRDAFHRAAHAADLARDHPRGRAAGERRLGDALGRDVLVTRGDHLVARG